MRNPLLKQCTKMTIFFIKQLSLILYCMYRAFYHMSNISQQTHKIIDIHKIYLSPLYMFQQMSCHLQVGFSRELQELLYPSI
jgi:hypothetical protein